MEAEASASALTLACNSHSDVFGARVTEGIPTVASMFSHIHPERLCSVLENVPNDVAGPLTWHRWRARS